MRESMWRPLRKRLQLCGCAWSGSCEVLLCWTLYGSRIRYIRNAENPSGKVLIV